MTKSTTSITIDTEILEKSQKFFRGEISKVCEYALICKLKCSNKNGGKIDKFDKIPLKNKTFWIEKCKKYPEKAEFAAKNFTKITGKRFGTMEIIKYLESGRWELEKQIRNNDKV